MRKSCSRRSREQLQLLETNQLLDKVRSISDKSCTDCAEKNRCLQLRAAKKTFAHEIEAICAT